MIAFTQYAVRMSSWWDYVVRVAGTDVQKQMALDTGISESAFSRWKKGTHAADAGNVVAFARAHNRPPVEALVAAGYLSESEAAAVIEVQRDLEERTDDELLAEVRRRMRGERNELEDAPESATSTEGDEDQEADSADESESALSARLRAHGRVLRDQVHGDQDRPNEGA